MSSNNSNDNVRNIFTYFPVFPWYPFFSILYQPSDDSNNNNNNSGEKCFTDQAKSFIENMWEYIIGDGTSYVTRMKHLLMFIIYALAAYLIFIHKDNLNTIKPVLITLIIITLIVNFLFAWFSWWNELEMSDDYAKLPLFIIYSSFAVLFLLIYFNIRNK